jgi:hypothetical protein
MPWDQRKKLLQLQVEPEFKELLREIAIQDRRSLSAETIYLIELGIERRRRVLEFEAGNAEATDSSDSLGPSTEIDQQAGAQTSEGSKGSGKRKIG